MSGLSVGSTMMMMTTMMTIDFTLLKQRPDVEWDMKQGHEGALHGG